MSQIDFKPHPDALYFHIAADALGAAKTEKDPLKLQQYVATVLVFSALCLEAYINQEYARHDETAKLLDDDQSFRLESKWLLFPLLLASPRTFDKGANPFQTFARLIALRNQRLVHFKPHKETLTAVKASSRPKEYLIELLQDAEQAERYHRCVGDMIRTLHQLCSGKTRLPEFLSGHRYSQEVPVSRSATMPFEALGSHGEAS